MTYNCVVKRSLGNRLVVTKLALNETYTETDEK